MQRVFKTFSQYVWAPSPAGYEEALNTPEKNLLVAGANEHMMEFHILKHGVDMKKFETLENLITLIASGGTEAAIWIIDHSQEYGIGLDRQDTFKWYRPLSYHQRMGVDGPEFQDRLHWQKEEYLRNTALILSTKKGWDHVSIRGKYVVPVVGQQKQKTRMGCVTAALLRNGANPDIQDACGNTALHIAVMHRDTRPIRALKEAGARHDLRNNAGLLPIDMLDIRHEDIGPFLYQQTGNDVNCYIFRLKDRKDWLRAGAEVRQELENWPLRTPAIHMRKSSHPAPEGL